MSPEVKEQEKAINVISEELKKQVIEPSNGNHKEPEIHETTKEYRRTDTQTIYLTIERGLKKFHPTITFAPATDQEWFALIKEVQNQVKAAKGDISFGFLNPYAELGKKKKVGSTGFKNRIGDKEFAAAMNAYFDCTAFPEATEAGDDELLDYDEPISITVKFKHNGAEIEKHINFKGEILQEDMDEFMLADEDKPSKLALASHAKKSRHERICEIGERYKTGSDYPDGDVPAWQLFTATLAYFYSDAARLGKF